jgi:hypothetical protein
MVSQGNDGDPHGKPHVDTGQERSPHYPRGNRFAKRAAYAAMPDRHLVTHSD